MTFVTLVAPPPHTIPGLMVTTPTSPGAPLIGGTSPNAAPPGGPASKSAPVTPVATPQQEQKSGGFMSRLFGNKNKEREKKEQEQQQQLQGSRGHYSNTIYYYLFN